MKILSSILFICAFLLMSCEEQPIEIPEFTVTETGKTVLIEELTGVSCPNCPKGVVTIESILALFGENVVTYGVHGAQLTKPKDNSKYDFRNPDAEELEEFLSPFWGKPAASINRVFFASEDHATTTSIELWPEFVRQELEKNQVLDIALDAEYDENNRTATINIGVSALSSIPGDLQLHVGVTESHLIDPQDDINTTIQDFEHNHVLKELVTQLLGDNIVSNISANQTVNRTYSYTVPEENNGEWTVENMEIIAFVTSTESNGEVLQATSIHIK
ncbi:MAG: Omp28-related outer membrane protein [Saprospiraceae bacterium]|nr:Omp28-related outer membrane protein [Saprospiraceae bacterium]